MSSSVWYAVAIAATAAPFLCFYFLKSLAHCVSTGLGPYFLRSVYYRHISTDWRGLDTTWFHGLLIAALFVGNASYLIVIVENHDDLSHETALLSTINLIPLALGCHMNFVLDLCGLSLDGQSRFHRWIARVALIEGLVHSIVALVKGPSIKSVPQVAAVVVTKCPSRSVKCANTRPGCLRHGRRSSNGDRSGAATRLRNLRQDAPDPRCSGCSRSLGSPAWEYISDP
jgi:hypothetical protein